MRGMGVSRVPALTSPCLPTPAPASLLLFAGGVFLPLRVGGFRSHPRLTPPRALPLTGRWRAVSCPGQATAPGKCHVKVMEGDGVNGEGFVRWPGDVPTWAATVPGDVVLMQGCPRFLTVTRSVYDGMHEQVGGQLGGLPWRRGCAWGVCLRGCSVVAAAAARW